jgi:hypothetical protein
LVLSPDFFRDIYINGKSKDLELLLIEAVCSDPGQRLSTSAIILRPPRMSVASDA